MNRREIANALLVATATSALLASKEASAQTCSSPCYPIDPAETAAGVTPTNTAYVPGDLRRYGAVGNGTTVCTTAWNQAALVASQAGGPDVFVPAGTFRLTGTGNLYPGLTVRGVSYQRSALFCDHAGEGFVYAPAVYTEAGISFEKLRIRGQQASSSNLVRITNATVVSFRQCNLRETNASLIKLETNAIGISLEGCVLESFGMYGLNLGANCSVIRLSSVQVNANSKAGTAVVGITHASGAGQISLVNVNVNGNSNLGSLIYVATGSGASAIGVRECYCELMSSSCIVALGTASVRGLVVENCQLSGSNSVQVDLANGVQHEDIIVRNVRNGAALTGYFILDPGSTRNFEFENASYNAGLGIVGYGSAKSVKKFVGGVTIVDGI